MEHSKQFVSTMQSYNTSWSRWYVPYFENFEAQPWRGLLEEAFVQAETFNGYVIWSVEHFMRVSKVYSYNKVSTGRTTAALHYVAHVCEVVWAVSENLHFDAPCAHTNSSIQLSSKYPLNLFYWHQNTFRKGGLGPGPPNKNTKKNYSRMVSCMVSFFEKLRFVCFSRIFFSKDFKKRGAMQIAIARVHG